MKDGSSAIRFACIDVGCDRASEIAGAVIKVLGRRAKPRPLSPIMECCVLSRAEILRVIGGRGSCYAGSSRIEGVGTDLRKKEISLGDPMKRNSIETTSMYRNWFRSLRIRLVFIFLYIGYVKKKIWAEIFSSFQRRVKCSVEGCCYYISIFVWNIFKLRNFCNTRKKFVEMIFVTRRSRRM